MKQEEGENKTSYEFNSKQKTKNINKINSITSLKRLSKQENSKIFAKKHKKQIANIEK